MRFTKLVFFIIPISTLLCGCPPEEKYTEYFYIKNNNIISIIDNTTTFNVDDIIYIESSINNSQTTIDNQKVTLKDFYRYKDEFNVLLNHSLTLYKESNFGNLISIPIDEEYLKILEGEVTTSNNTNHPNINIQSILKGEVFRSKFGITLKEKGTYYLSSSNTTTNGSILITGGDYEFGRIEIRSKIINSNEKGLYMFTVN